MCWCRVCEVPWVGGWQTCVVVCVASFIFRRACMWFGVFMPRKMGHIFRGNGTVRTTAVVTPVSLGCMRYAALLRTITLTAAAAAAVALRTGLYVQVLFNPLLLYLPVSLAVIPCDKSVVCVASRRGYDACRRVFLPVRRPRRVFVKQQS